MKGMSLLSAVLAYQEVAPFGARNYEEQAINFITKMELALEEGGNITLGLITEFVRRSFSAREVAHGAISEATINNLAHLLYHGSAQ